MALKEEEKTIRNLRHEIESSEVTLRRLSREFEIKKGICRYQENLINKLLNTIQSKKIDVNTDLEKGYN